MSNELLGLPLHIKACELFVNVANQHSPNWQHIRVDGDDFRVFAFPTAPELNTYYELWTLNDGGDGKVLVGVLPISAVDYQNWGIDRTDWEAMLAEIAGQ